MTGAGPGDPVVGPLGPVAWVAVEFDGDRLAPAVVGPLAELVDAGTVRLLDAAVVHKDAGGAVRGAEPTEAGVDFDAVDGDVLELLSDDDLDGIAAEQHHAGPGLGVPVGEPAAAPSVDDLHAQLLKLGELRTAGLLTEDEFAVQKSRLLGG
ncbi:DUF6325 family protein [Pseudonocardia sp. NPDC046786]|uniref:SHOCT domain-containing protein n=1 Tax=Pseudonocardia sp. NPDC046786 TaxID=3155471 RepID=UPI00340100C4